MSERVFEGLAKVTQTASGGMITVRADLADVQIQTALTQAGIAIPDQRGVAGSSLWMSPDELLILCPGDQTAEQINGVRSALSGAHHLVQDVSDMRGRFVISGGAGRDVLAKLCPIDFRPAHMRPGQVFRTRLAQVPCAIWMPAEDQFDIVVFRSVADYVWNLLQVVAQPKASVGYFHPRLAENAS